jgi:hypothetical protein
LRVHLIISPGPVCAEDARRVKNDVGVFDAFSQAFAVTARTVDDIAVVKLDVFSEKPLQVGGLADKHVDFVTALEKTVD